MIAEAIKSALLDWGVVVVPDLGTFWSEESGAEVSPSGNMIKPPHVSISFSSSEDDIEMYSLVIYISKNEDLDEDEVAIQVSMFVANLQQRIEDEETAPIGDLGYFVQGEDGEVVFRQRNESNITPDSFGLPKITATPLMEDEIEEEEEEYQEYEEEPKGKRPIWLFIAIPVILVLTAVGYFVIKPDTSNNITQEEVIEEEVIEETPQVEEVVKETTVEPATKPVSTEKEVAVHSSKPRNGNYHIVISSFSEKNKAEVAVKQAEEKGFTHVGVISSNGKYRVALKGYNSHQDAKEELASTQKTFKGAWIWRH